jgi:hypothetical protein
MMMMYKAIEGRNEREDDKTLEEIRFVNSFAEGFVMEEWV